MTKDQQKAPADWLKPRTKRQEKLNKPRLIKPRLPTEQEQKELIDSVLKKDGCPEEEREFMEALFFGGYSAVVVFDTYATYDSEYEGKLLVVIGDTSPLLTASFIWRKGSVEEVTKQTMKQIKKEMREIDRLARQHAKQGL